MALALSSSALAAGEPSFDPNLFYRLTTKWQGDGKSLDVVNDGTNTRLKLADSGAFTGQAWKIVSLGNGFFRLTTQWQGDGKSLDVVNDGTNNKLQLANTGGYTGQAWKISPLGSGFFRLTSQWQGDGKSLDVVNDGTNDKLQLANTGGYTGQSWKIVPYQGATTVAVAPAAPAPAAPVPEPAPTTTGPAPAAPGAPPPGAPPKRDDCVCTEQSVPEQACTPKITLKCLEPKLPKMPKGFALPRPPRGGGLEHCVKVVDPKPNCETRMVARQVCTGQCQAAPPPVPPQAKIDADPKQAFLDAYKKRPTVAARQKAADDDEKRKYGDWSNALSSLNALATKDGQAGTWKTQNVCVPKEITVSGYCKTYAQECRGTEATATFPFTRCTGWRNTSVCLLWVPSSVSTKNVCSDVPYFDVNVGNVAKSLESSSKSVWEAAKTAATQVTTDIVNEALNLWAMDKCRLGVDALNGRPAPELKAFAQAVASTIPAADKELEKQLMAATANLATGDFAKHLAEAKRLKGELMKNLPAFKALFTVENLCDNPGGLANKLAALGLKPAAETGFLGAVQRPGTGGELASLGGPFSPELPGGGGSAESPHFYMGWSFGGNMAAVLGVQAAYSIVTDYKGNSVVLATLGAVAATDVSAAEGIMIHFYPASTLSDFYGPPEEFGSWGWDLGVGGGEIVVGGISYVYPSDFSAVSGIGANIGVGVGLLPVAGSLGASFSTKLTAIK